MLASPVGVDPYQGDPEIPDLLHAVRRRWGDLRGVAQLVRFAFEGGDSAGLSDAMIEATPMAPSEWHPDEFSSHLFLDDLVRVSFQIKVDDTVYALHRAFVVGMLSNPPSVCDVHVRHAVLDELVADTRLRDNLEKSFLAVRELCVCLEGSSVTDDDSVARKLDILWAFRGCVESFADGFGSAGSVLSQLREIGCRFRASAEYERLLHFLETERNCGTVDVRLRLGSDGRVRGLHVLGVGERRSIPSLPGFWLRAWHRVASLAMGHHYSRREVVTALLDDLFSPLVRAVVTFLALLGPMQFYLSAMGFRDTAEKRGLVVSLPEIVESPERGNLQTVRRELIGIFNPLLFLQNITPVVANLEFERHDDLVLLTGPNSGGKTRLLQAIAIVQCLGQAGVFVPAARANLVYAPAMYVSLVDEAAVSQSEGKLGTELARIRKLFEEMQPSAMAVIDELCSGTNPTEGEEIASMVISLLPGLRSQTYISTHFLGLAQRLERERSIDRLSFIEVELDADNRPTYGFVPGVAKTSLAGMLAARLGVTREDLQRIVESKPTYQYRA